MPFILLLLLLGCSGVHPQDKPSRYPQSRIRVDVLNRIVVKPPKQSFKTVLSIDAEANRNILSAVVLIEVEHAIKRYLLAHPELLPQDAVITTADDFDVELADYFKLMTGASSGGWIALYLASRGGQGFSRRILDDRFRGDEYGFIPSGSAEGLRVFFKRFATVIYFPFPFIMAPGKPFEISNPLAAGVSSPALPPNPVDSFLRVFVGNTTMADMDTSVIVPAFDMISGTTVLFVRNVFDDIPVTSTARMVPRFGPRSPESAPFIPDLQFDEGANYFIKDVAGATGSLPLFYPAFPISRVDNDTVEFLCIDGVYPVDSAALIAGFFTASEHGFSGFEEIAIMSVGTGVAPRNWTSLANAGLAGWLEGFALTGIFLEGGQSTTDSLLDYVYYSNPNTKLYQYLKIDTVAPMTDEERMTVSSFSTTDVEAIGFKVAEEYRQSIEIFVRDFLFG